MFLNLYVSKISSAVDRCQRSAMQGGSVTVTHEDQTDPGARFGLLASAIAGRTVVVTVTQTDRAWSDGTAIYLPETTDADPAASVAAQAALISAGTLRARSVRSAIRGRAGAADRFLSLEVSRATRALDDVLPRTHVDRVTAACPHRVSTSVDESARRAADGTELIAAPPAWFGRVKPSAITAGGPTSGIAIEDGDQKSPNPADEMPELDEDDADGAERSRILELLSAPALRNPLAAAFQRMLGMGRTPSDGNGGDELPVGGYRVTPVSAAAASVARPRLLRAVLGQDPAIGTRYPEWDCHRGRYREQWCSVVELDPAPRDATVDPVSTDRALRRELLRLGLRRERHRRQPDGDDIDIDAVIRFQLDRTAGAAQDDPRVYETRLRTGRDLGMLVLLDATGSSAEQIASGAAFDEHRLLAERLTHTLDNIGDRIATYGFYSRGRGTVRMLRVKSFDDAYDHAARTRMANLTPSGFTRLGAAIRHATSLLAIRSGTSNQLLVLVGDGFAYDDGYEDRYARQDTRRALAEASISGVGCLGVRIGPGSSSDVFDEIWSGWPSHELPDADDLARVIRPAMTAALLQARTARRPARMNRTDAR
jgi:nitric oxide reductase NorD protein